jgi:hypothetical protein
MQYTKTEPCNECPFLKGSGFTFKSLIAHAIGEFPCHKACKEDEEGNYVPRSDKTPHCAGALIFLEKRKEPHQMMRICGRLGLYDPTKLNMKANVGSKPSDYAKKK